MYATKEIWTFHVLVILLHEAAPKFCVFTVQPIMCTLYCFIFKKFKKVFDSSVTCKYQEKRDY